MINSHRPRKSVLLIPITKFLIEEMKELKFRFSLLIVKKFKNNKLK